MVDEICADPPKRCDAGNIQRSDGSHDYNPDSKAEFKVRPRLVLTHSPSDYMLDHEMTSALARAAAFGAPVPNFLLGRTRAAGQDTQA